MKLKYKYLFFGAVLAYGMAFAAFILLGPAHHGWLMAIGLFNYACVVGLLWVVCRG